MDSLQVANDPWDQNTRKSQRFHFILLTRLAITRGSKLTDETILCQGRQSETTPRPHAYTRTASAFMRRPWRAPHTISTSRTALISVGSLFSGVQNSGVRRSSSPVYPKGPIRNAEVAQTEGLPESKRMTRVAHAFATAHRPRHIKRIKELVHGK